MKSSGWRAALDRYDPPKDRSHRVLVANEPEPRRPFHLSPPASKSPEGASVIVEEFERDGVVFDRDGIRVMAFEVDHGPLITPAYGYRIEHSGRVVVISGNTRYNENVVGSGPAPTFSFTRWLSPDRS